MLSLDIGCGKAKTCQINVDINRQVKPTVVCDAQHLPFKNNVFQYIYSSHVIEHLTNPALMLKEINRVATPNAIIILKFPTEPYASNTKYYLKLLIYNFCNPFLPKLINRIIKGCLQVQKRNPSTLHKWKITPKFISKYLKIKQIQKYGSIIFAPKVAHKHLKFPQNTSYKLVCKLKKKDSKH